MKARSLFWVQRCKIHSKELLLLLEKSMRSNSRRLSKMSLLFSVVLCQKRCKATMTLCSDQQTQFHLLTPIAKSRNLCSISLQHSKNNSAHSWPTFRTIRWKGSSISYNNPSNRLKKASFWWRQKLMPCSVRVLAIFQLTLYLRSFGTLNLRRQLPQPLAKLIMNRFMRHRSMLRQIAKLRLRL